MTREEAERHFDLTQHTRFREIWGACQRLECLDMGGTGYEPDANPAARPAATS
jgi:hypothetical protein